MSLTVKTETGGGDFKLLPAGTHIAVCIGIFDFGPQVTEYMGDRKEQNKLRLQFEVPAERTTWKDAEDVEHEGPMTIGKTYTASLYEKAKLCEHLESWRGRQFTEAEKMGFDLNAVLGKPCMLTVMHKKHEASGNQWADIIAISPPPKGTTVSPENTPTSFDFDNHTEAELQALPQWMRDKVEAGKALMAEQRARVSAGNGATAPAQVPAPAPVGDFTDDDIPF